MLQIIYVDIFLVRERNYAMMLGKELSGLLKIVQLEVPVENQLVFNACTINEVSKNISRMQSNSTGVYRISLKIAKSVVTPIVGNFD